MSRFSRASAFLIVLTTLASLSRGDDSRFAESFLEGLRERGYDDLALEYLGRLRGNADLPAEFKNRLDYEEARVLIASASRASEPEQNKERLDKARAKLDVYLNQAGDAPEKTEALVELAHLLYERGRVTFFQAEDGQTPAEREARLAEARASYDQARKSYTQALGILAAKLNTFPNFIREGDPARLARERVQSASMNAELQISVCDYEEAQTYPADSPKRAEILKKATASFETIHNRHRTQLAGFTARMWQGKCLEERGDLGAAMGVYNGLIDHTDPRLRPLQRKVEYFRILVSAKRGEHALAADDAVRWIQANPNERRSYEALGVRLELAKNILAQVPDVVKENERSAAIRRATDLLTEVMRVYSPFRAEAAAMLKKFRPASTLSPSAIAGLSYDEASAQAAEAISIREYDRAGVLLRAALRRLDARRDVEKLNETRHKLAFVSYMSKRYYESAVYAEHLIRRYPRSDWAAKAADIAMSSLVEAYNTLTIGDRSGDLERLLNVSRYVAETWPDAEQGDSGRMTAGQILLGLGRYDEAASTFESVRSASSKWSDAQARSGDAHWKKSLILKNKSPEDAKAADAEVLKAVGFYETALKARKSAGAAPVDPGVVNDTCDLAGIHLESGKANQALALLRPIAVALNSATKSPGTEALKVRTHAVMLRSRVASGQVELAINDMRAIEASGGAGADQARLYYELGKLLERERDALEARGDAVGLRRVTEAYRRFLTALVESKTGQSNQSLQWAGANLLKLGSAKEADAVFVKLLENYAADPDFKKRPGAVNQLLLIRLKRVGALRGQGKFNEAEALLNEIAAENKSFLELQMERGLLLNDRAAANTGANWSQAFNYWQNLGTRLRAVSPKPEAYFEAWYQAALALQQQGKGAQAKQTLNGIMRLSPNVGTPEMKAKYQALASRLP